MKRGLFNHLDKLEVFTKIVEFGSFAKAAEASALTQPSISNLVKTLEKALATDLFTRSSRGVNLTDAGKILFEFSEKIAADVARTERNIALNLNSKAQRIEIGTKETYAVSIWPIYLQEIQKYLPGVSIRLRTSRSNIELIALLTNGFIDAAVMPDPGPNENIVSFEILKDRFQFYVSERAHNSKNFRSSKKENLSVNDVKTFVYNPGLSGSGRLGDVIERAGLGQRFESVDSFHIARAMMIQGLGAALLPVSFAAADLDRDLIKALKFDDFNPDVFGYIRTCFCVSSKNRRNKTLREVLRTINSVAAVG